VVFTQGKGKANRFTRTEKDGKLVENDGCKASASRRESHYVREGESSCLTLGGGRQKGITIKKGAKADQLKDNESKLRITKGTEKQEQSRSQKEESAGKG